MTSNYEVLFAKAAIRPEKLVIVDAVAQVVMAYRYPYKAVTDATGVPWWCIGAIHLHESALSMKCHLHNGDPLVNRTVRVPKGRPKALPASGHFPYTWQESAIDALQGFWKPKQWSLAGSLEFLERYNGLGYRLHGVNSPYLWSFTDQYSKGLFVADGAFDPNGECNEIGGAALLKVFIAKGAVNLVESGPNS